MLSLIIKAVHFNTLIPFSIVATLIQQFLASTIKVHNYSFRALDNITFPISSIKEKEFGS